VEILIDLIVCLPTSFLCEIVKIVKRGDYISVYTTTWTWKWD